LPFGNHFFFVLKPGENLKRNKKNIFIDEMIKFECDQQLKNLVTTALNGK
jgi:hypothetical protein